VKTLVAVTSGLKTFAPPLKGAEELEFGAKLAQNAEYIRFSDS
jgi:hypothetical protein